MGNNEWTFTGTVRKFGEIRPKGQSWGKIWISINIPSIMNPADNKVVINNNDVMVTVPTAYGDGLDAKRTQRLKNDLKEGAFVFIASAKVDKMKRSRKNSEGEWEDYFETGVRAYPKNILFKGDRYIPTNIGLLTGEVKEAGDDTIIVEEEYYVVKTKEVKTRPIPIYNNGALSPLVGRKIFAQLELSGRNKKGEYKTMGFPRVIVPL